MIMCWGCITWDGIGYLCRFVVNINADSYIKVCIRSELPETVKHYGYDKNLVIFQQDGAKPHTAKATQKALLKDGWHVLDWPASSPDLNPIEEVWAHVKRKILEENLVFTDKEQKWNQVLRIWNAIPPEFIQSLYRSLPGRCASVVECRGGNEYRRGSRDVVVSDDESDD
jgi:hypothetical protein